jgi:TPP-dependent pyruvate/acetoin dehydrogenase alpha subunit
MESDVEKILYSMLLIRRVEEEIVQRYKKQQMRCPVHLSIGQEAVSVGGCHHLRKEDSVFSTHRSHAAYLAKGGSLEKMALELHGKIGGCCDGRVGSMSLMDKNVNVLSIPIVASAIPLAVGVALANKMDGNGNIVVCFFGDAAVEEGVFHESANFASLMQLPIIFVCEDNSYSVDTHISKRQPHSRNIENLGMMHGISVHTFRWEDNVFEIALQFKSAIEICRKRCMPIFYVAPTKRSHQHCGVDREFKLETDPLDLAMQHTNEDELEYMEQSIRDKINKAFDAAEAAPLPTPDMASKYVYA